MSQGGLEHASYLTRQQLSLGPTTVGASKTTVLFNSPASNVRVRAVNAVIDIAGTSATSGNTLAVVAVGTGATYSGTTTTTFTTTATLGTATLGTSAQGTVVAVTTDANLLLNRGGYLAAICGTDATCKAFVFAEAYIDPLSSWTGN